MSCHWQERFWQNGTKRTLNDGNRLGGYHVFTVYEGDWGDYYAVRVEVWHHDTSTGSEHKVNEKIYRMQGWQR